MLSTFPKGQFCICERPQGEGRAADESDPVTTMLRIRADTGAIEALADDGRSGQVWEYDLGKRALVNPHSRKVLELSPDHQTLIMRPSNGAKNQRWLFREKDSAIVNPSTGKVLEIEPPRIIDGGADELHASSSVTSRRAVRAVTHDGTKEGQQWKLRADEPVQAPTADHGARAPGTLQMSEEQAEQLQKCWPALRVAFLGLELCSEVYDTLMARYHESRRLDLTDMFRPDGTANLSGLGLLELSELCPDISKIFLHTKMLKSIGGVPPITKLHLMEVKRKLKLQDDAVIFREIMLSDCTILQVKQAATVDQEVVSTMVPIKALPEQLLQQEAMLDRQLSRRSCSHCGGVGLLQNDTKRGVLISLRGESAAAALNEAGPGLERTVLQNGQVTVQVSWLYRNADNAWRCYDPGTTARLESEYREALPAAFQLSRSFPVVRMEKKLAHLRNAPRVLIEIDMNSWTQKTLASGTVTAVKRVDESRADAASEPCWVCKGTGEASQWVNDAMTIKATKELDEDPLCLICYSDPGAYGISTQCDHFFCEDCIRGSLEAIMDTAQFPALCPMCRVQAHDSGSATGDEVIAGHIGTDALSFLEQRKVISKEFVFRFARQNTSPDSQDATHDDAPSYFECPAKCGRFLVDQQVEFLTDEIHGVPVMKLGACPCGTCLCLSCKLEENLSAATHQCPSANGGDEIDALSLALVAKAGKKCPKCKSFVQRTEGCHIMMCGT